VAEEGGGNVLTKKLGPQPRWAWAAEFVGGFLLFRYIRARQNANSGLAQFTATPLTGGNTIPTAAGAFGGPTSGAAPTYSTLSAWITAALGQVSTVPGYSNTSALNDLTAWLNGGCVSAAGFNFIGNFIASGGLPPGFSTPPTLSVCPSTGTQSGGGSTAPPPPPPASPTPAPVPTPPSLGSLTNNVLGNVVSMFQSGSGWVWVTDSGYVYASPGAGYYGGTDAGAVGGPIASKIVNAFAITSGPNAGGYTLVASNGDTYNFGPNANYSPL
jgi:hypothetical protein